MNTSTPVRCALVGCGQIAEEYATTLGASSDVTVVACADTDPNRAAEFASRHGIPRAGKPDEMLDQSAVDLAVILTPPADHVGTARPFIAVGIAVHVEKPLALTVEAAYDLLNLGVARGVLIGAAPDTVLASPARTAAAALRDGLIGEPTGASAAYCAPGPETWHPAPEPLHDLGPLYDMGPYYLSQLISLLGPVSTVTATVSHLQSRRTIGTGHRAGQQFTASAFTHTEATMTTVAGVPIGFTASWNVHATRRPHLEIYGTHGTLALPNPNFHTGPVLLGRTRSSSSWTKLPPHPPSVTPHGRGMGVIATARGLRHGTPLSADGQLASHIVEILAAITTAGLAARAVNIMRPGANQDQKE